MRKKKIIKEIIENFDYKKVEDVMDYLNWKWVSAKNGVPTIDEMKELSKYVLKSAYKQAKEHGREDVPYFCSTGGLKGTAVCNKNGKVVYLSLEFIVTEWDVLKEEENYDV